MERLGLAFAWGNMAVEGLLECYKAADRFGYEVAFLAEGVSADSFTFLSAAAKETDQIRLATGVATVFTRTPLITAAAAATVDALSHGRFVLGLGSGHLENHLMRNDVEVRRPYAFDRPLQRLRETVEIVRLVLTNAAEGGLGRLRRPYLPAA